MISHFFENSSLYFTNPFLFIRKIWTTHLFAKIFRRVIIKSGSNYEPGCFWIFWVFYRAKDASNDTTTFSNVRFIATQKAAPLLRKYHMLRSSKSRRFHWMYTKFCRKECLLDLEEKSPLFQKFFVVLYNSLKSQKIPGSWRTAISF